MLAAGEVKFNNGTLVDINNKSGHYIPTSGQGMNYLRAFTNQGEDVSGVHLSVYKWEHNTGFSIIRRISPSANFRPLYQ